MSTVTEMQVHIDCAGCENRVRKALQKLKGVDEVDIDMAMQKVTVTGWADQKKVLKTVRKTGRRAELWQFPYNPELRNSNYAPNIYYSQNSHGGPVTYAASQPPPASAYNYYKHGCDYAGGGLAYRLRRGNSSIFGNRTGDAFSDENTNGCFIM